MIWWGAWIVGAYLIGSIPFGVLISRSRGIDIRQHGSRNIGATNVMRVLGKGPGTLCFALDVAKGAGPVIGSGLTQRLLGTSPSMMTQQDMWLWLAVAVAVVLGHMFSLFLRFGGGKGVATAFGAMLAMWPLFTIPAIVALLVWIVTLKATRYVSIASMTAAATLPVVCAVTLLLRDAESRADQFLHATPLFAVTLAMAGLVVFRHRGNIRRILRGEEPKVGEAR